MLSLGFASSANAQLVSDDQIAAAVQREYLRDAAVPYNRVEVVVQDGVVTLEGEVATLAARQQAENIAGIVRGVRSVVNRLRLKPSAKAPEELRRDVEAALRVDPVAESHEVDVVTGPMSRVTLTGSVDSWAEQAQIEKAVKTVPGVMSITNKLKVAAPAAPRGHAEIAEEISARLRWDVRVDDSLINVLVLDGSRVVLSGTVGSFAEKRHAEQLAHVAGVAEVFSTQLTVEPWALNDDLRRANIDREPVDSEISSAVKRALTYDPRVSPEGIAITTRNGVVELTGRVANLVARRAAGDDALNTVGVTEVRNELELAAGPRDDNTIRDLIANALRGYGLMEDQRIDVRVSNGNVRLRGDTDSAMSHWQAEEIAMSVQGVEDVRNDLTINGREPVLMTRVYGFTAQPDRFESSRRDELKSDRQIYDEVQSELFWSPFVDVDEINVEVDDGVVTLTGRVDSAREYAAARENAFEGGALTVENRLDLRN